MTFEIDEVLKTEQILILDDPFLEEVEFFNISIEAINNLDEGFFPVILSNSSETIAISDNDGELLNSVCTEFPIYMYVCVHVCVYVRTYVCM